jgi:hypothetical protein
LNAVTEAPVQEVIVGSLYIAKATVVVEEFDLLYGEPTDTVVQQEVCTASSLRTQPCNRKMKIEWMILRFLMKCMPL